MTRPACSSTPGRNRKTIDISPTIEARLKSLADDIRCPTSGLVNLALAMFLDKVSLGEIDLRQYLLPSKSPRYESTVHTNINNV